MKINRLAVCVVPAVLTIAMARAQEPRAPAAGAPKPETVRAFDTYARSRESHLDGLLRERNSFLWTNTSERRAKVRAAGVVVQPWNAAGNVKVAGGMIHDWVGVTFIQGASVERVLALLQDYDNHKYAYKPDVVESKTLERRGNDFKVRLRLFRRKVVTVVLDADTEVHYAPLEGSDWSSRSYSTRIVEIANPGGPRERVRTPAEDHGYLWRLNSYWLFRERDGGVYVECDAVSLSRAAPAALAWLIDPIVRNLPRDILTNTLQATRALVLKGETGAGASAR